MTDIAKLLSGRVPRYTSYPTAPHFHAGIDTRVYCEWLSQIPADQPLSLYFHIPFCDSLCWFCGCNTTVVHRYAPVRAYLDHLMAEIALVARALRVRRTVSHIHWGGGSPSMLQPADIAHLNAAIRNSFTVLPDAAFAVEIDPRGFSNDQARAFAQVGVNRASIGIQDFDPKVQDAIHRRQSYEETAKTVELLRDMGISQINLDLIYGLPYQALNGTARTVSAALTLEPNRLAVFGYAHVPAFKKHQALIPRHALPDAQERLRQETLIHALILAKGYESIGLDHYAKAEDALLRARGHWRATSRDIQPIPRRCFWVSVLRPSAGCHRVTFKTSRPHRNMPPVSLPANLPRRGESCFHATIASAGMWSSG